MIEKQGIHGHLEPMPARYGYIVVFGTMFVFQMLNLIARSYGRPRSIPAERSWLWRNVSISWVHAFIVGILDPICFYVFPEMTEDPVDYHNIYSYTLVAFSAGYFCYDFIDYVLNTKLSKGWPVVIHHIVVGGSFLHNLFYCNYIGYTCVALLTEVNTVFLHSRKLMQLCQFDLERPWLYRLISTTAIFTFIFCRFGVHFYIVYGMWREPHRMTALFAKVLGTTMSIVIAIDFVLFLRLLKNDVFRSSGRGHLAKGRLANDNIVVENGLREKKSG